MNTFRGFFLVHKWWNAKYHRRKHKHSYWNLSCWKTRHDWWFRQIFVIQKGWSHWHKSIFRVAVFTCSFEVEHVWLWNNMALWNGKQLFWSNDVTQLLHFYIKIHKSTWAESWRYDNFACMWSFFESFNKNISKSVIHQVILLLTKLCTHIMEELDSNSIIIASQPNMGFNIACFVMLQYLTLLFLALPL